MAEDKDKKKERERRWREANPERYKEIRAEYRRRNREVNTQKNRNKRAANPEYYKRKDAEWYARNRDRVRAVGRIYQRTKLYGLTQQQYQQMWIDQNSKCAICKEQLPSNRDTHIDHCHKTGKIRGLLCKGCNKGLGQFADDPVRLKAAALYVEYFTLHPGVSIHPKHVDQMATLGDTDSIAEQLPEHNHDTPD